MDLNNRERRDWALWDGRRIPRLFQKMRFTIMSDKVGLMVGRSQASQAGFVAGPAVSVWSGSPE